MSYETFRVRFLIFLLIAKLLVLGWLFLMYTTHGYSWAETKDLIYIIAPIFAAHLIPGISFYAKSRSSKNTPLSEIKILDKPNTAFVWIAFSLITIYALYNIWAVSSVPGTKNGFAVVKEMLALAEILFGILIGVIVSELYHK